MDDIMDFVNTHVLPHWAFIAWLFVAMLIGQVAKNTLWTKTNAIKKKPHWFWWWMRKTMVLHPVAAGALVGLIWQNPEPGVNTLAASMGYFALAGGLSTWAYELLRGLAKKKGIDIPLPGITKSSAPPPPATPPPPPPH